MKQPTKPELNELAIRMLGDYDNHTPGMAFAEGLRLDLDHAWLLQDKVTQLREQRGETVVGYKVGCVFEGNQRQMGLPHPVWGRLWSSEQYPDGVELLKDNFDNIAIEAEFAISLSQPIDPREASPEQVVRAVDSIFPVLELHNLAMRGDAPHGHELVANNCIHAGVVHGVGVTDPHVHRTTDLALTYDGETVDSWSDIHWPDQVLSAIQWLAEHLDQSGRQLDAGNIILTSALGPPIPVGDKHRVDVTSSGFGNVHATFL